MHMDTKKDIYHHQAMYNNWKYKVTVEGMETLSKSNSDILIRYIFDMEIGQNVSNKSKKGSRSYGRLNVLRRKCEQLFKMFEDTGVNDITRLTEKQAFEFFNRMNKGEIKRKDGKDYYSSIDFVRALKSFWHWWIKVNRKEGKYVLDICEDLELRHNNSTFVYITKDQLDQILPYFTFNEQVFLKFLFDSIIRFPTEVSSLKVKNIYLKDGDVWVNVPDEISKVIGRDFNLLFCGQDILNYIKKNNIKDEDYLFYWINDTNQVYNFNKKLKQVAVQVFGDVISHPKAGGKFSELSGYDFRHSGTIYLRQLAQKTNISLDSIRQRGGWTDFKMLNYYTKFLGLTGEIKKEQLLVEEDKTKFEKRIDELERMVKILCEDLGEKEAEALQNMTVTRLKQISA